MFVDPPRLRGPASDTRATAQTTRRRAPLRNGTDAAAGAGAEDDELALSLRDVARALDKVVGYHAQQFDGFAEMCVRGADSYENADHNSGQRLRGDLAQGRTSDEPVRRGGAGRCPARVRSTQFLSCSGGLWTARGR